MKNLYGMPKEYIRFIGDLKRHFTRTVNKHSIMNIELRFVSGVEFSNALIRHIFSDKEITINSISSELIGHIDSMATSLGNVRSAMDSKTGELITRENQDKFTDSDVLNSTIVELNHGIFIPDESIMKQVIRLNFNFKKAYSYLKCVINHELGHVIVNNREYIGITLAEYNNIVTDKNNMVIMLSKSYNMKQLNITDPVRHCEIYHTLFPEEVKANEVFGLTWRDFVY